MNGSLIWYILWPLMIYVSYRLILITLKIFEKNQQKNQQNEDTNK